MDIGAFLGKVLSAQAVRRGSPSEDLAGSWDWEVVGESHYQDNLWTIVGEHWDASRRVRVAKIAALVPEPGNPYDANAVAVHIDSLITGYLSREDARQHQRRIVARQDVTGRAVELPAVVAGGGLRDDGPGQLGVFLRHDPRAFGMTAPAGTHEAPMRTGLSAAIATDLEDDSYDLSWLATLPAERTRAIPMLRKLLQNERDVLDRHFMFNELEDALYASREAFASALDEYDESCRQHDSEMDAIRRACMVKWSKVPLLDTYRQMCIRLAKEKRFDEALWWAERGVGVYGTEAALPDAVLDLSARAASYRDRLASKPKREPERRASRVTAPVGQDEDLICAMCGEVFQHRRARGRKPSRCPSCAASRSS